MRFVDLAALTLTWTTAFRFLAAAGILVLPDCPVVGCHRVMRLIRIRDRVDPLCWRCSFHRKSRSVRFESFLFMHKISLQLFIRLVWAWAHRIQLFIVVEIFDVSGGRLFSGFCIFVMFAPISCSAIHCKLVALAKLFKSMNV